MPKDAQEKANNELNKLKMIVRAHSAIWSFCDEYARANQPSTYGLS